MLGAIAGDLVGSVYEGSPVKQADVQLFSSGAHFTDNTVLTMATAEALLGDGDYATAYRSFHRAYPNVGYAGSFYRWLFNDGAGCYASWGNGAAVRVSPVGFALESVDEVLAEAARTVQRSLTITQRGSRAPRLPRSLCFWLALVHPRKSSKPRSKIASATTSNVPWTPSGPVIALMSPVRARWLNH